ncbi:MAG: pilB1 [Parcubacteria group bacterium]|nr:pilB1 [Parcubacteria group bacterium]
MGLMPAHFDTDAEDKQLAGIREREEEDLAQVLSQKYGYTYTDLTAIPVNVDALRMIPEKEAREAEVVAFDKNGKHISIALRNPQNELLPQVEHALEAQGLILSRFLISRKSLEKALARYEEFSYANQSKTGVFAVEGAQLEALSKELSSVTVVRAKLDQMLDTKNVQVSHVFELVLAGAFSMRASDIHFEPEEETVRLRYRLDGQLTDVYAFSQHTYQLIASRIKLISGLKLNVHGRAQDGRFSVPRQGTEVEIRTSLIPGAYGESFVMRLLDPSILGVGFKELGVHPKLLERLEREITRPNGMLLTTGPTGSGKTTTLYSFLQHIHTPEIKIVTIEDPVEYHLPGIVQTQTDGKEYTFASGLRSVLRQDPDVIMVGEIRDSEVAETAIQAALTGHFVFSTLHTNNAAGTFPRLVDLGSDPKAFASAISVAMAQRLVRTLDPEARKQVPATEEEKKVMERILSTLEDMTLLPSSLETVWVPEPNETSSGYKGRIGLYEAIFMDEELGNLLRDNPSEGEIATNVRRQGFLTVAQDGVLKAIAGQTSLEEVFKVVDLPRD